MDSAARRRHRRRRELRGRVAQRRPLDRRTRARSSARTCVGTQTLCEAAPRGVEVDRFHHVSTCEVYGDLALDATSCSPSRRRTGPARRTTRRRPAATSSRACVLRDLRPADHDHELRNNYGPYQFPEKVIPLFTTSAARRPAAAAVRVDGRTGAMDPRRRPLPRDRRSCSSSGRVGETYHVGTGVERSIEEIADGVLAALGKPASLKTIVPDRPGHDRRYAARLVEDHARARLGAAASTSTQGSRRPSHGTRDNRGGGSRCTSARRSTRPLVED